MNDGEIDERRRDGSGVWGEQGRGEVGFEGHREGRDEQSISV